jgi:hypothetical protein
LCQDSAEQVRDILRICSSTANPATLVMEQ